VRLQRAAEFRWSHLCGGHDGRIAAGCRVITNDRAAFDARVTAAAIDPLSAAAATTAACAATTAASAGAAGNFARVEPAHPALHVGGELGVSVKRIENCDGHQSARDDGLFVCPE